MRYRPTYLLLSLIAVIIATVNGTPETHGLPAFMRGMGDAHGHGPYPITNCERTLLSAWLKQGRDWLML
jgi:hypothetical protein